MQPAVLTFRPDNFLTIGFMVLVGYTVAVLAAQGLIRLGVIKPAAPTTVLPGVATA